MKLLNILKENRVLIFFKLLPEMCREYWLFSKGNARCDLSRTPTKLHTEILMATHALEKAFSLSHKRQEYGKEKAKKLINDISSYISKYGYDDCLNVPISLLFKYIEYHLNNGINSKTISAISAQLNDIIKSIGKSELDFNHAGVIIKNRDEMLALKQCNFEDLCKGRYSLRQFGGDNISLDKLLQALDLAKKSPSACNRQAYRAHIFSGELKDQILEIQGGSKAFYKEAQYAIVITAEISRYYTNEYHLGYVDASLFAMTLLYSLTFYGIGSIPLTLGRHSSTLHLLKKCGNIPSNEIPVLMIAAGSYPEKMEFAMSHRNPVSSFTTIH